MGLTLGYAGPQGQDRTRPIQGLHLTLLVHTEHYRVIRGVQVQPHEVAHLLHEKGIGRKLEGLGSMRLQPEGSPDAGDRGARQLRCPSHRARAPVGGLGRRRLQGASDQVSRCTKIADFLGEVDFL